MGWVKGTEFKDLVYYVYKDNNDKDNNDKDIAKIYDDNKARLMYMNEDKFDFKKNRANTYIINWNIDMSFKYLNKTLREFSTKKYTVIIHNLDINNQEINEIVRWNDINFTGKTNIVAVTFKQVVDLRNLRFLSIFKFDLNNVEDKMIFCDNSFSECFYFLNNDIKNLHLNDLGFLNEKGKNIENSVEVFKYYSKNVEISTPMFLRQTCNYIKNYFMQQNNHIESNSFYALEMLARGKELEENGSMLEKLVFNISKGTSNHGQSIGKPIVYICAIALIWWCNTDYIIGIAFPIIDIIDNEDTIGNIENFGIKLLYIFSKLFSAVLWWQLIRAIRKDIKR